ncbi:hypothetical protein LJR230_002531 [Trinickia sp. LjRoot230]|uniref:HrpE/YscL family type III secretion apparatus protein n=1 Tax=Trinickia sp. LjRoot230 TaxID=3342288 RepID=UPI003ECF4329
MPPADAQPSTKLIYRADELGCLRDAAAYVQAARETANAVLQHARSEAAALDERVVGEYARRLRDADTALLKRAIALESAYRNGRETLVGRLETVLDAALDAALRRLAAALSPAERMRAVVAELERQVGIVPSGCLHLHAADEAALRSNGVALPWVVQVDGSLEPGACRLTVGEAEWTTSFDSILQCLLGGA